MKQAKAAYAFTARSEAEISFGVGDVILILEEDSSGWGKGRTKEYREGYFPLAYVQVEELSDSDSDEDTNDGHPQPQCIALYDFAALSELQLSFSKGDIIKIIKKGSDNDWWDGTLERSQQWGLIPSNYVKVVDIHDQIIQAPPDQRITDQKPHANNNFIEVEQQYKTSESVESKQHKKDTSISNFRVEDSFETEVVPALSFTPAPPSNLNRRPTSAQSVSEEFSTKPSPLDVSVPFELHKGNYHREFATLSPISPNLSAFADDAELARRRHSMNISSASPLALSAFSGEYTRDFDALCLLYPFVPSSVSQPPFTPKLPTDSQATFISPPSTPFQEVTQQPISQPISIPSHQIPQSRPQSAPQFVTPSTTHQSTGAMQSTPSQPTTQPSSTPPKPVVPKLPLTSSSPDRKDGYSNREQRERSHVSTSVGAGASAQTTAHAGASPTPSSANGGTGAKAPGRTQSKYGAAKSPGARRDASAGAGSASKRKVKLEASLSMGKRPNSTITHSNSTPEQTQDPNQEKQHVQLQQDEVENLKRVLQQESELRAHLESVVHDAHGKMHSASQYIKDLKAELFQAHMDISQLRVTNRQLNEQLDKYQLVTRVTVATQTERDENIDKIRVLTEQIHELEVSTDLLNEQITTLKHRTVDRSPRIVDRSPSGDRVGNEERGLVNKSDARVDYEAVKQQFARVRECLLLEKDIKDRLIMEKAQVQDKLMKTEQHSKQIRRKLLTELQLKSDLNVRNQHVELQMQKLKEQLATYKHPSSY